MTSTARLGLLGLSAFLLLFPLTLARPGLPTHLKADEAAYYGMAMSLAHDGDLVFGPRDVDRFFLELPYQPVNNLILMSADGWHTVTYGKPYVYSLLAAPFARLFGGAHGLLCCNTLLLLAMIWMGAGYLRRHNDDGLAVLYSTGFFVLSVGFVYVYWLQPEVFNMAAVTACLFFGLPRDGEGEGLPRPRRVLLGAVVSGAALALAIYNKPMLALLGVAPLWTWARERRWRPALAWVGGATACLALVAGGAQALTGTPTAYLGVQRGGFTLCAPGTMPVLPTPVDVTPAATPGASQASRAATATAARAVPSPPAPGAPAVAATPGATDAGGSAAAVAASPTGNSYSWLFRVPDTSPSEFADNVLYFLLGRHTGLLLYMPFAALSVLLFLLHARRSGVRWLLLGSTTAIALFFLLLIAWNWQGGGGFVGNRYFVNVYPAFLFLVTRIRPRLLVPAGYAIAGVFLSPLLLSPFGLPGSEPTLQMHVRGIPYRWFPLELTLRNVPGYQRVPLDDVRLIGRKDVVLPQGGEVWVAAATPVELYLLADHPLGRLAFAVTSPSPGNRIGAAMGSWHESFELGVGESRRIEVPPQQPTRRWTIKTGTLYAYRLTIETSTGRPRLWERELPARACPDWPWQPRQPDSFYTGAALAYLGNPAGLDADVFAARWERVAVPAQVRAGALFVVHSTVRNGSRAPWRNHGGARVRLAYHWLDAAGTMVVRDGERTDLPQPLPPGGRLRADLEVVAPSRPGRYTLVLDPVFEQVAWFSDRDRGAAYRAAVDVLPSSTAAAAPTPRSGR